MIVLVVLDVVEVIAKYSYIVLYLVNNERKNEKTGKNFENCGIKFSKNFTSSNLLRKYEGKTKR